MHGKQRTAQSRECHAYFVYYPQHSGSLPACPVDVSPLLLRANAPRGQTIQGGPDAGLIEVVACKRPQRSFKT